MKDINPILLDIPESIETKNLILRSYEFGDGKEYYKLLHENYDHFKEEVTEINSAKSVEDMEIYVRTRRVDWISRKRFVPLIIDKKTNKMIL